MLEISPVLAGTFDQPDYQSAVTNLKSHSAATATEDADGVDTRRYTNFDRTAADSGTATDFSFDDFLDMINPLEHIPLISSAYRAITGDQINPVSRVAGDILYGAATGGVSALASGASAIGDVVMQAKTGKSTVELVADALFGSDDKIETKVAGATSTAAPATTPAAAAVATTAVASASALAPAATLKPLPTIAAAQTGAVPLPAGQVAVQNANAKIVSGTNKQPFGGVMDMSNKMQAQDMAMALSAASPTATRIGNTIYTGRLMTGARLPPAPLQATQPATAAATAPASNTAMNESTQLPQGLLDDIAALKAINQYKNTASGVSGLGSNVNVTN